ncbi:MAG: hypothetical protein KDA05_04605 [Phycisphaerales bacterium]|nr:hypothetical protein [Phycisphaerales bacterium]
MRSFSNRRRLSLLAGLAAGLLTAPPVLAQAFESVWGNPAVTEDFSYRSIEALAGATPTSRRFVVAGSMYVPGSAGYSDLSYWDGSGRQVWASRKTYSLAGAGSVLDFHSVHEMANGDLLVGGYAKASGSSTTSFVMRVSPAGLPIWNTGIAWSVPGDASVEAIELSIPSQQVTSIDTVSLGNGPVTRVSHYNAATGNIVDSFALRAADGSNIVLNDIEQSPLTGEIYGAGYIYQPQQIGRTACIVRVNPSLPAGGQFTGLWTYADVFGTETTFTAVDVETFGGVTRIYAGGTSVSLGFPSSTTEARLVAITNTSTMAPTWDIVYPVNLVPARGGVRWANSTTCAGGATAPVIYLAGKDSAENRARVLVADGSGAPSFLSGATFGGGTPPYTTFAGMALDPLASYRPVMVGSHRLNAAAASEYQAYVVRTACDWTTPCSTPFTAGARDLVTAFAPGTPVSVPVQISSGGVGTVPAIIQYPVAVGIPTISVSRATACAHCGPDLTGSAIPGTPGYGVPDGVVSNDDFFFYLAQFAAGNQGVADLTTTAIPGQPGYGEPNGVINNEDFFYYLTIFSAGC